MHVILGDNWFFFGYSLGSSFPFLRGVFKSVCCSKNFLFSLFFIRSLNSEMFKPNSQDTIVLVETKKYLPLIETWPSSFLSAFSTIFFTLCSISSAIRTFSFSANDLLQSSGLLTYSIFQVYFLFKIITYPGPVMICFLVWPRARARATFVGKCGGPRTASKKLTQTLTLFIKNPHFSKWPPIVKSNQNIDFN